MFSYSSLSVSFWGYALETAMYILNLVPSKFVPKTPIKLWLARKPSLNHIRIWGAPAHVLNQKSDKMDSRTEVCMFIKYPKGTRGEIFYSTEDKKVLISTHATFLEDDYIKNYKPKSKVILEELASSQETPKTLEIPPQVPVYVQRGENVLEGEQTQEPTEQQTDIPVEQVEIQVPHVQNNIEVHNPQQNLDLPIDAQQLVRFSRSGREIQKPSRYVLMGESYQAILIDHDNDPISYNEALKDVDV